MKNIKVEWCENFIRAAFTKHMPPQLKNPGIEGTTSGRWQRGRACGCVAHTARR